MQSSNFAFTLRLQLVMSRPSLHQSQGCYMIPQHKTIRNSVFYVLAAAAAFVIKSILQENSLLMSPFS